MSQSCNQEYFRAPLVRVDPDRRCSAMLIYGTHLVVLPFRQEGVLDENEQEGAFTGRYNVHVNLQEQCMNDSIEKCMFKVTTHILGHNMYSCKITVMKMMFA